MAKKHCYDYPRPMVTVDCVVFHVNKDALEVLLIQRKGDPFRGAWALPGGFIQMKEALEESVVRELREETGIKDAAMMFQHGVYADPGRDPRGRVISIAHVAILNKKPRVKAGDDAAKAEWFPVEATPSKLAFDHAEILGDALMRLAANGRTTGILFGFLPAQFTKQQLEQVLKAVYGMDLDAKHFLPAFVETNRVKKLAAGKFKFIGWQ